MAEKATPGFPQICIFHIPSNLLSSKTTLFYSLQEGKHPCCALLPWGGKEDFSNSKKNTNITWGETMGNKKVFTQLGFFISFWICWGGAGSKILNRQGTLKWLHLNWCLKTRKEKNDLKINNLYFMNTVTSFSPWTAIFPWLKVRCNHNLMFWTPLLEKCVERET